MHKIWILSKTMIKTTSLDLTTTFSTSNKKKEGSFLQYLLMFFLGLYLIGIIFVGSYYIINTFAKSGAEGMIIELFFIYLSIFLIISSFTIIPSIFFFDKDLERFLILPITIKEFVVSKMIQMVYVTYKYMAIFVLPFFIMYVFILKPTFFFTLNLLISIIIYPILPIALLFLLMTLLFSFMPFFKNKNLFTYIAMFVALILGVSINFLIQKMISGGTSIDQIMINILGNPVIATPIHIILPSLQFFVKGINESNLIIIILSSLFNTLISLLLIVFTQKFYLKIIQSVKLQSSKDIRLDYHENKNLFKKKPIIKSIMIYDLKSIINSPIMALNYLIPVLIVPGGFVFQFILLKRNDPTELDATVSLVTTFLASIPLFTRILLIHFAGFMAGLMVSSLSLMTSTSISREGIHMQKFKSLPINLVDVLKAKISLTVILTVIPFLLTFIVLGLYLSFNILDLLFFSLFAFLGSFSSQILAMILELIKPKLSWSNEAQAVKQNGLSVIPMFTSFGLIGLLFYGITNFDFRIIISFTPLIITMVAGLTYRIFPYLIKKFLLPAIEHEL